jgi:hypothetical protein
MSEAEPCLIHAVAVGPGSFKWFWSTSSGRRSRQYFRYFYDCVADANANGCSVDFRPVVEHLKRAEDIDSGQAPAKAPHIVDAGTPSKLL